MTDKKEHYEYRVTTAGCHMGSWSQLRNVLFVDGKPYSFADRPIDVFEVDGSDDLEDIVLRMLRGIRKDELTYDQVTPLGHATDNAPIYRITGYYDKLSNKFVSLVQ